MMLKHGSIHESLALICELDHIATCLTINPIVPDTLYVRFSDYFIVPGTSENVQGSDRK